MRRGSSRAPRPPFHCLRHWRSDHQFCHLHGSRAALGDAFRIDLRRRKPRYRFRPHGRRGRTPDASAALNISPPSAMRRTTCAPKRRTSRCVPDQPGTMPRPVSGRPSLICVSAMRISAAAASSSPPPSAWPLSAAISGYRSVASRSKTRWPKRTQCMAELLRRHRCPGLDIAAGRKGLALAGEDRNAHLRVGLHCIASGAQALQHGEVEGIELFRPRQGDRGDSDLSKATSMRGSAMERPSCRLSAATSGR